MENFSYGNVASYVKVGTCLWESKSCGC